MKKHVFSKYLIFAILAVVPTLGWSQVADTKIGFLINGPVQFESGKISFVGDRSVSSTANGETLTITCSPGDPATMEISAQPSKFLGVFGGSTHSLDLQGNSPDCFDKLEEISNKTKNGPVNLLVNVPSSQSNLIVTVDAPAQP